VYVKVREAASNDNQDDELHQPREESATLATVIKRRSSVVVTDKPSTDNRRRDSNQRPVPVITANPRDTQLQDVLTRNDQERDNGSTDKNQKTAYTRDTCDNGPCLINKTVNK